jgi:hyperosmotically inducible protein|tara:strand:+ start:37780 stop:38124 length:345 start_codon:yes stop_codon:yes gene_type:complete
MKQTLTLILILSTVLLSACTTLLVGGAGAGGYAVGTDERPFSVISQDLSITASVKTTLIKDKQIDAFDINVDTYRGVVTLHGHVKTSSQLNRAVQLSASVKGVNKVLSKLKVIE